MAALDEVTLKLSACRQSTGRARALLRASLAGAEADDEGIGDAELVLSELVTNALRATDVPEGRIEIRIVLSADEGMLLLEVSDTGPGVPTIRTPTDKDTGGRGLLLVEAIAHSWGFENFTDGLGKRVWAELKVPGLAPPAPTTIMAAAAVSVGQAVRVRGEWRAIRTVRGEPYATGGLAILLGLEDGTSLRLPAIEPLTVRNPPQPETPQRDCRAEPHAASRRATVDRPSRPRFPPG
ncbi:ATP-binding protein [Streptomyces marincola]|uniref:ATP-binding protein n=1 Tax=Streptomyces marincola TaxID=2878388 RepID=UPI001CF1E5BA|nr:ATP-binding protein [Streptomyces marincola]UCM87232.1 ATP-binding protein [Streptomyces marincola]